MNEAAKRTANKLNQKQTIALSKWWEANHPGLVERQDTYVRAAELAAAALQLPINQSHVTTMAASLEMPLASTRAKKADEVSTERIIATMEKITATIAQLSQHAQQVDRRVAELESQLAAMQSVVNALSARQEFQP